MLVKFTWYPPYLEFFERCCYCNQYGILAPYPISIFVFVHQYTIHLYVFTYHISYMCVYSIYLYIFCISYIMFYKYRIQDQRPGFNQNYFLCNSDWQHRKGESILLSTLVIMDFLVGSGKKRWCVQIFWMHSNYT